MSIEKRITPKSIGRGIDVEIETTDDYQPIILQSGSPILLAEFQIINPDGGEDIDYEVHKSLTYVSGEVDPDDAHIVEVVAETTLAADNDTGIETVDVGTARSVIIMVKSETAGTPSTIRVLLNGAV